MSKMLAVSGQVTGGRGKAKALIQERSTELNTLLGVELTPGSLNVVLTRPLMLNEATATTFDNGERLLWPAVLNDTRVWICRWRQAPLHVAEVLSVSHLRKTLALGDGDTVQLRVDERHVDALSAASTVAWAVFWLGRRNWCYINDTYYYRTRHWCTRLGITQQGKYAK